jgi:hypothetical protein
VTEYESLPADWTVWSDEPEGRAVFVYRPDVFDTDAFPAPCLPTLYVTPGRQSKRRPGPEHSTSDTWFVTLSLEPEVIESERSFDERASAIDGAIDLATEFADGQREYRASYQVPRAAYLDRLDELTGRSE